MIPIIILTFTLASRVRPLAKLVEAEAAKQPVLVLIDMADEQSFYQGVGAEPVWLMLTPFVHL